MKLRVDMRLILTDKERVGPSHLFHRHHHHHVVVVV